MIDYFVHFLELVYFFSGFVVLFLPSKLISSDAIPFGRYHIINFLPVATKKVPLRYIIPLIFPWFLFSSYRSNVSIQHYYVNRFISLRRALEFLFLSDIGKILFIPLFLLITSANGYNIASFLTIASFFLSLANMRIKNHFFIGLFCISLSMVLLEKSSIYMSMNYLSLLIQTDMPSLGSLFLFVVGIVLGYVFKDALMFNSFLFWMVYKESGVLYMAVHLLVGFMWGEAFTSLFDGKFYRRSKKLFFSYIHTTVITNVLILVWYRYEYFNTVLSFWICCFVSTLLSSLSCFSSSAYIVFYVKNIVNSLMRNKPFIKESAIANRRVFKCSEMNFLLARRLLKDMGQISYDKVYEFLKNSNLDAQSFKEQMNRSEETSKIKMKNNLEEIESILEKTSNFYMTTRNHAEYMSIHEMGSIYYSMHSAIFKMERLFYTLDKETLSLTNDQRYYLFDSINKILDFIRYNNDYLRGRLPSYNLQVAQNMEEGIDKSKRAMGSDVIKFLKEGRVECSVQFFDMIKHIEHIGDYNYGISRRCRNLYYGKAYENNKELWKVIEK